MLNFPRKEGQPWLNAPTMASGASRYRRRSHVALARSPACHQVACSLASVSSTRALSSTEHPAMLLPLRARARSSSTRRAKPVSESRWL